MKSEARTIALAASAITALVTIGALVGCGSTTPIAITPSASPVAMQVLERNAPDPDHSGGRLTSWGAAQEIEDVFVCVKEPVEDTTTPPSSKAGTVMVADVTLENCNVEPKDWSINEFTARDQEGRRYRAHSSPSFSSGILHPQGGSLDT